MRRSTAVLHFLCALLLVAAPAAAADRITIDDLLNAEDLDPYACGTWFSPDGHALVYTLTASPTKRPTWGYVTAGLQTFSRVFVTVDGGTPHEIVGDSEVLYGVSPADPWAPDGSGVLLLASRKNGFGLAKYDLASGKVTALPGLADNAFVPMFAWTPDGRIAYASAAAAGRQRRADAQALRDMNAKWNENWDGRSAPVTVHSANTVFAPTPEAQGALMLADPRTGVGQKLADGDFTSIVTSPGGRFIAAVRYAEGASDALNYIGKRGELHIFALTPDGARLLHRLTDIDAAMLDQMAWSPSGKTLLVIGRPRGETKGTHLYTIDAASGKRRALYGEGLSFDKPTPEIGKLSVGWLGERPLAVGQRALEGQQDAPIGGPLTSYEYGQGRNVRTDLFVFDGGKRENLTAFAKSSVRDFLATDGGAVLVVLDGALWKLQPGKPAERLTAPDAPPLAGFGVDRRNPTPPAQSTYFHRGDVERVSLWAIADGRMKRMNFEFGARKLVSVDVEGDIVASAPDQATTVSKVDHGWSSSFNLNNATTRVLATVNAGLKDKAIAPVEKFTYTVGKRTLTGFVQWPPNAKKNVKLPSVVTVYGGEVFGGDRPPYQTRPSVSSPVFSGQLLAAEGYAVIYPSLPLGAGGDSDQPQQLADSAVAAVDAVAAGGRIDPKRVGVMGQSYGGFSTAALLTKRSDRFKAGIALAGIYDFFHAWGSRPLPMVFSDEPLNTALAKITEGGQGQLGKPFWQASDAYMRNSPIFHVETLNTPLLMLHGDFDLGATDLAGAERMYTALLRAGKKPTLIHYWGEGHVATSAAAQRDQWLRITTWFDHYLRPAP